MVTPRVCRLTRVSTTQKMKSSVKDLIILENLFQENTTSKNIVEVSENLKQIVNNDTLNDTDDIVLLTSLVEKIIFSFNETNKNESQVCIC